jgi:putative AlgH/UPF0301 family transcriptional regulator
MAFRFRHGLSLVIWALLGASVLLAQSRRPGDLGVGKLLVVPRQSPDPNFAESVVLLVHYAEDGTVGLMINRQTPLPVSCVLRDLKGSSDSSQPVYVGGPVQMGAVQALLQSDAGPHALNRSTSWSTTTRREREFLVSKMREWRFHPSVNRR